MKKIFIILFLFVLVLISSASAESKLSFELTTEVGFVPAEGLAFHKEAALNNNLINTSIHGKLVFAEMLFIGGGIENIVDFDTSTQTPAFNLNAYRYTFEFGYRLGDQNNNIQAGIRAQYSANSWQDEIYIKVNAKIDLIK